MAPEQDNQDCDSFSLEAYNLMRLKWLKVAVFHAIIFSIVTIVFGSLSLGWNNWQTIDIAKSTPALTPTGKVSIAQLSRSNGLFYTCVDEDNLSNLDQTNETVYHDGCIVRDIGQISKGGLMPDKNYWDVIRIRVAQIGLHTAGLLVFIVLSAVSFGFQCIWFKSTEDTQFFRRYRLLIGLGFAISGFALLISILLWHIGQDQERRLPSASLPYEFPKWPESVKNSAIIRLDTGYIFIWIATIAAFISSWIMLFSTCCFTQPNITSSGQSTHSTENFHDNMAYDTHVSESHAPHTNSILKHPQPPSYQHATTKSTVNTISNTLDNSATTHRKLDVGTETVMPEKLREISFQDMMPKSTTAREPSNHRLFY